MHQYQKQKKNWREVETKTDWDQQWHWQSLGGGWQTLDWLAARAWTGGEWVDWRWEVRQLGQWWDWEWVKVVSWNERAAVSVRCETELKWEELGIDFRVYNCIYIYTYINIHIYKGVLVIRI